MGYGDYVHWTAIIRDLYYEVNSKDKNDVHNYIVGLCKKVNELNKNEKIKIDYGITNIKKTSNSHNFKFYVDIRWKGNIFNHEQAKVIFKNNFMVTDDNSYPNLIYLTIKSDGYLERGPDGNIVKLYDSKHVVDTYAKNLGLEKYNKKGFFHFTDDEYDKVKTNLPSKKFILVEPQNHKNLESRLLSFDFMQNLVNKIKESNDIEVVQISPSKFADKESQYLNNCIVFNDVFTYREALLFGKYSEFSIVPHGGLSIGLAALDTKVIAIYPCIHRVPMTTYETEIVMEISDGNHYLCFLNKCETCNQLRNKFNNSEFNNIISKSNEMLN